MGFVVELGAACLLWNFAIVREEVTAEEPKLVSQLDPVVEIAKTGAEAAGLFPERGSRQREASQSEDPDLVGEDAALVRNGRSRSVSPRQGGTGEAFESRGVSLKLEEKVSVETLNSVEDGLGKPSSETQTPPALHLSPLTLPLRQKLAFTLNSSIFWTATLAGSCFLSIKVQMKNLVSVYLASTSPPSILGAPSMAVKLSSCFQIGIVLGLLGPGLLFSSLPTKAQKLSLLRATNVLSITALLTLSFDASTWPMATSFLHILFRCALLSAMGVGMGCSLYQPLGLFFVGFGGPHCGAVSGYLDGLAFLVSALMALGFKGLLMGGIGGSGEGFFSGWSGVFLLCASLHTLGGWFTEKYLKKIL